MSAIPPAPRGDIPRAPRPALAGLVAALAAATILSQFLRTSGGVIGPELMADLKMTPEQLGAANGAFFLALAAMQVPVGMLFDRFGPRRTVFWLNWIAVAGCAAHAVAAGGDQLFAARLLMGIGCGGNFMAAVLLYSRWYPANQLAPKLSVMFALSQGGTILAATPLALVSQAFGWRPTFAGVAVITALIGIAYAAGARDRPPGHKAADAAPEAFRQTAAGLIQVWRTPGLPPILAMHLIAYASMLTVLGLWAAPYLHDVHGLDGVARGHILSVMAAMQVVGVLAYGRLAPLLGSLKWTVMTGGIGTVAVMAILALWSQPPLWAAAGLLIVHCLIAAYGIVIVAQGRGLFPDHLAGRGVTTVNLAQVLGCFALPVITGAIIGFFPADNGAAPEVAYRAAFACIGILVVLGLAAYTRAPAAPIVKETP